MIDIAVDKEKSKKVHSMTRNKKNKCFDEKQVNYVSHKNIQTYTRCRGESPTYKNNKHTSHDTGFGAEATNFTKSNSSSTKETSGLRDLLPRVQRMGRGAEVRYFNDLRKCIRDAFRHVCEEETVTCPEIERRFSIHRKEHHSPCQNQTTGKSLDQRDLKICYKCKKPLPCQCILNVSLIKQQKNKISSDNNLSDQHASFTDILHQKLCCCRFCKKEKEYEEKLLKQVLEWLQEIPVNANYSFYDKNRRQETVRKLVNTLLKYRDMNDKQKEEIKKCLDILPMWQPIDQYDRGLFKNKLIEDLLSRLCILSDKDNYLKEIVSNWIDELLVNQEPVNNPFVNKEHIINKFVTRIQSLTSDELSDEQYFKEKIQSIVTDLIKNTPIESINHDVSVINRATDKLVKDITSIQPVKVSSTKPGKSRTQYRKNKYSNQVSNWIDNRHDPETSNTIMNLNKSEGFDRNHNIESSNVQYKIKDDIKKIIDIIKKDNLDSRTESFLLELITIKLGALPEDNMIIKETNMEKPVSQKIKQFQNHISTSDQNQKQQDNFIEKPYLQGFVKNKLSQVEDVLPGVKDDNMKETLKDEITNTFSTKKYKDELSLNESRTNQIRTDASFSNKMSFSELSILLEKDIQSYVKEQVSNILNKYSVDNINRNKIGNKFTNILTDQIMRGDNDSNFKEIAYSMLQEINLPESKLEDLYKTLLKHTREMSLSFKTKTSSFVQNISTEVSKEREKDDILINIEREITAFISEITDNCKRESVLKYTATTKHLAAGIEKVLSNFKHSIKYKKDMVTKLIFNFLRNLGLPTDTQSEKLAKKLVKQLLKISLHTSTPKSANENYFPSESKDSTISSIRIGDKYFDTLENESLIRIYESAENGLFDNKLENIIGSWMRNTKLKKIFSEAMINDIIRDIIQRKNYLQLNSEILISYDEEHKFLKLLFSKWMDNNDSFPNVDFYIDSLINQILGLYMPKVTNDLKFKNDPLTVTSTEILKWIQKLPPDHLVFHDDNYHKLIAKEVTNSMRTAMNQNLNPELVLENEIQHWLPKIVKVSNEKDFHGLTENLKDYIKENVLRNFNLHKFNNNQFMKNIKDAIMMWLKSSPIYQRRNTQEKLLQENLISNLARDLNHIISSLKPTRNIDYEELILKSIETQLKQFPVDPTIRYDEKYQRKTALEILNHLKNLRIFPNSSNNIVTIKDNISDWLQNIPLRKILPSNNVKAAVNEINSIFSEFLDCRLTDANTVQHYKNKIINVLKLLPLGNDQSNDKLQTLVDNLFEILKGNLKETLLTDCTDELESFKDNTKKLLIKEMNKWCEQFPINIGDNPEDKAKEREIKDHLISGLVNILSNLTINSNLIDNMNAYENLLKNEIGHLFDTLSENTDKMLPLQNDLVNIAKDILNRYRNVLTVNIYKKHLRDIIDKSIPVISNFSSEQQNSLENMKDKLIEAFISLYKITNDDKTEFKEKLKREVNEFCSNYMKRYPASPIEADKLCNDLYTALQNVSFLDSTKLDKTQIKEIKKHNNIETMLAELPLENIESNNLLKTKFADFLLTCLKDDQERTNLEQEILEWLKQFSFKPEHKVNMTEITKYIIRKLGSCNSIEKYNKNTEQQQQPMQQDTNIQSSPQCLFESSLVKAGVANDSQILLQEYPAHSRYRIKSVEKDLQNQHSRDIGNQTEEVRPESCNFENTHECHFTKNDKTLIRQNSCTSINCTFYPNSSKNNKSQEAQTLNRPEVSPHIIVKEYYWDSTASRQMDNSQHESQSIHSQLRRTVPSWPLPQTNVSCKSPELSTRHSRSTRIPYIASRGLCPPNMSTIETKLSSSSSPMDQQQLDEIDDPWAITKSPSNGRHEHKQSNLHLTCQNIDGVESFKTKSVPHSKTQRQRFPKNETTSCSNAKKSRCRLTDKFYLTRELPDYMSCAHIEKNISDLDLNNFLTKERDIDHTVMCRCYGRKDAKPLQRQVPYSLKMFDGQHINNLRKCFKCRGALCPHPSAFYFN